MDPLEYKIDHFFKAFSNLVKFIENECKDRIEGAILACAYIDSLSGYKYGGKSNRDRFANFIKEYSGMNSVYELISLPRLKYHIMEKHPRHKLIVNKLVQEFKINEFDFVTLGHSVDVKMDQLDIRLRRTLSLKDLNFVIKMAAQFEYTAILWRDYRCNLIHETRLPEEEAMNLDESIEPYYTSRLLNGHENPHQSRITFGIPQEFIIRTLKNCLESFEEECRTSKIDPFKNAS